MATLVTVLRSGGRYDAVWVERLARGVRLHAPASILPMRPTHVHVLVPIHSLAREAEGVP